MQTAAAANVSTAYAFLAGLLSFLSPCVLPLVPGYISLLSGTAAEIAVGDGAAEGERHSRLVLNSICFILGFSLVFITLGAAATSVGQLLREHQLLLSQISGLVVILFGLHLTGIIKIGALYGDKRIHRRMGVNGGAGAFAVGFAFAFGWTPCIGPILATILILAAGQGTLHYGLFLLTVYSAGLAVPFLLTSLAIERFTVFYKGFRRHLHQVEVVSGVLLLVIGALLVTHRFTVISGYLVKLPFLNKLLI